MCWLMNTLLQKKSSAEDKSESTWPNETRNYGPADRGSWCIERNGKRENSQHSSRNYSINSGAGGIEGKSSTYYAAALCKYRKAITILQLTGSSFIVSSPAGVDNSRIRASVEKLRASKPEAWVQPTTLPTILPSCLSTPPSQYSIFLCVLFFLYFFIFSFSPYQPQNIPRFHYFRIIIVISQLF